MELSIGNNDIAQPSGTLSGRAPANGPFPRDKAGTLIAKIGDAAPILIGARADAVRAPTGGRLYLGVNDDAFEDNKGNFNVQVVVTR